MSELTIQTSRTEDANPGTDFGQNKQMDRSPAAGVRMACHRSGRIYFLTCSFGQVFCDYRGHLDIYKLMIPNSKSGQACEQGRVVETWLHSKGYGDRTDGEEIRAKLLDGCRTGGDFIQIV